MPGLDEHEGDATITAERRVVVALRGGRAPRSVTRGAEAGARDAALDERVDDSHRTYVRQTHVRRLVTTRVGVSLDFDEARVVGTAPQLLGDRRAPGDSAADGPTSDGGACNTLVNTAPVVPALREPSALPSPMGGILEDGTYHLTAHTFYTGDRGATGPTGTNARISMLVAGAASGVATLQVVSRPNDVDRRATFIATTSGTSMSLTASCGGTGAETLGYTASDGGFEWILSSSLMAQTFTKQ